MTNAALWMAGRRTAAMVSISLLGAAAMAGCSKPEAPDTERRPEPQAAQATQLRDAIKAPIDQAKQVEAAARTAADAQREAIDAAGG